MNHDMNDRVRGTLGTHRGQHRNDNSLREDVLKALYAHPEIDTSEVEIIVQEGDVIITGTVHSPSQKKRIESCVENVFGVREVFNEIQLLS